MMTYTHPVASNLPIVAIYAIEHTHTHTPLYISLTYNLDKKKHTFPPEAQSDPSSETVTPHCSVGGHPPWH